MIATKAPPWLCGWCFHFLFFSQPLLGKNIPKRHIFGKALNHQLVMGSTLRVGGKSCLPFHVAVAVKQQNMLRSAHLGWKINISLRKVYAALLCWFGSLPIEPEEFKSLWFQVNWVLLIESQLTHWSTKPADTDQKSQALQKADFRFFWELDLKKKQRWMSSLLFWGFAWGCLRRSPQASQRSLRPSEGAPGPLR